MSSFVSDPSRDEPSPAEAKQAGTSNQDEASHSAPLLNKAFHHEQHHCSLNQSLRLCQLTFSSKLPGEFGRVDISGSHDLLFDLFTEAERRPHEALTEKGS